MSKLVIVESPAKAKTIKKYLGSGYDVVASMGHVRDLPKKSLGVDVNKNYRPQYLNITGKEKLIRELKDRAAASEFVYLATDPDREGEAISWHLAYLLGLDVNDPVRITFDEITQKGIKTGMSAPRPLNMNLVDSQQARRVLDRIVGYKISPFLWKKVRRGLSAGRVQSVAVSLLVDRERKIQAFVPKEYWNIEAVLRIAGGHRTFTAALRTRKGVDPDSFRIHNEDECRAILDELENAEFSITNVKKGSRKRSPEPPFTTSTMQQEASRKLNFVARRTMRAAQELYEGVDVKGETTGLITYMRTDSLRISEEADSAVKSYIRNVYGDGYVYPGDRKFRRRGSGNVQDAHEAIRPTSMELDPETVKPYLTSDQYRLYRLIWNRFVASRMADQLLDTLTVDIEGGNYEFRTSGSSVKFDGFTCIYVAGSDEKEEEEVTLPDITADKAIVKKDIKSEQKFTQPPFRYTEASLIKALEENGIGRPSTYAPTIGTIIDREYVERDGKSLKPTYLGTVVTDLMNEHFPKIVDEKFSANMEKNLDRIEEGSEGWIKVVDDFYTDFAKSLEKAEKSTEGQKIELPVETTDVVCELCGRKMVIKTGRYGKFLACPGFPECRNTKRLQDETKGVCPKCGGTVVRKRSRKGHTFFACEKGTECGFMTWNEPSDKTCPQCGSTLFRKKGRTPVLVCEKEGCGYTEEVKKND